MKHNKTEKNRDIFEKKTERKKKTEKERECTFVKGKEKNANKQHMSLIISV